MTAREDLLQEALRYVSKDRNSTYDAPENNFARIAGIMDIMGYEHRERGTLQPFDVSLLMLAVKMARLAHTPTHRDSWTDTAGYAACGYECMMIDSPGE